MITITIPISANPFYTANIFSATFNAVTPNRYQFDRTTRVEVISMRPRYIYLIDKISFSANMPEGVYQEAIDTAVALPRLFFTTTATAEQPVFSRPLAFINYVDNQDSIYFFQGESNLDSLNIGFEGRFSQPAAIAGQLEMELYIQMTIFEIKDTEWNNMFVANSNKQGEAIPMRGKH